MHIHGLHENDAMSGTAHQALKKTLDMIPQGGNLKLAQPFIQKFKIVKMQDYMVNYKKGGHNQKQGDDLDID